MRRILSTFVMLSSLLAVPLTGLAQNNPGLTINWGGGISSKQQLNYHLEYGTPDAWDRYYLKVRPQKLSVSQISISYPKYYKGTFDSKAVEMRVKRKKVALAEVKLDPNNRLIELKPQSEIPADTAFEVVLSNVRNPSPGGMYYFNAHINSSGDIPISRYIGTWVISIYKS